MSLATELFGEQCVYWDTNEAVRIIRDSPQIDQRDKRTVLRDWSEAASKHVNAGDYLRVEGKEVSKGTRDLE